MSGTFGALTFGPKTFGSNSYNQATATYENLQLVLDDTTRAEYLAQPNAQQRAAIVVARLNTAATRFRVYDALGVQRAEGTFVQPWATSNPAGVITLGEVTAAGVQVANGGAPNELWYARIEGAGGRFMSGGFGVQGSRVNFLWNDTDFTTGQAFGIGDVVVTVLP